MATVEHAWPPDRWRDLRVAVAVSGGPDSVATLRALVELKSAYGGRGDLAVIHFDHRTRGEASAADARWVADLAASHGLPHRGGVAALEGPRAEDALRRERRVFFREAVGALGARALVTGHQADDQAETVLFRLLRGTGPRGAAGIRSVVRFTPACTLVRPLLGVTRGEVLSFLASRGQAYRDDATNADASASTRNWLRGCVLPLLESRFPAARERLAHFAQAAAESADLVELLAGKLVGQALVAPPATLRRDTLAAAPGPLAAEALRLVWRRAGWPERAMTALHWRALVKMAHDGDGARSILLPGGVTARRDADLLVLAPPDAG